MMASNGHAGAGTASEDSPVTVAANWQEERGSARSLRQQHHQLTRELILRAVVDQLEASEISELTVPEVARAAGVSLRTVYRHFSTREALLEAAGQWIAEQFWPDPLLPESLDRILEDLATNPRSWDEHPNLVRAMAVTRAGTAVRSARRARRLELMRRALQEVTANLPAAEQRRAEAVFGYLTNMLAWVVMRDENGFSGEQVGDALKWALEVLIENLRHRNEILAGAEPANKTNKQRGGSGAT